MEAGRQQRPRRAYADTADRLRRRAPLLYHPLRLVKRGASKVVRRHPLAVLGAAAAAVAVVIAGWALDSPWSGLVWAAGAAVAVTAGLLTVALDARRQLERRTALLTSTVRAARSELDAVRAEVTAGVKRAEEVHANARRLGHDLSSQINDHHSRVLAVEVELGGWRRANDAQRAVLSGIVADRENLAELRTSLADVGTTLSELRSAVGRLVPAPMKLAEPTARVRETLTTQQLALAQGVLHLGAHIGQEAPRYAHAGKPVVWVEAMPDIYRQLVAQLGDYPLQRALCALLSDTDGKEQTFFVSNNDSGVSSSLFEFGPYSSGAESLWPSLDLHMVAELTLTTVTLDSLLHDNGIDPADYNYWVVDLQGAELLALRGASATLRRCNALIVEVSSVAVYEQAPLWPELRAYLEAAGFAPRWEPELDHDDVLFVRVAPERFQAEH